MKQEPISESDSSKRSSQYNVGVITKREPLAETFRSTPTNQEQEESSGDEYQAPLTGTRTRGALLKRPLDLASGEGVSKQPKIGSGEGEQEGQEEDDQEDDRPRLHALTSEQVALMDELINLRGDLKWLNTFRTKFQMRLTKQTARISTGGKKPRKQLATKAARGLPKYLQMAQAPTSESDSSKSSSQSTPTNQNDDSSSSGEEEVGNGDLPGAAEENLARLSKLVFEGDLVADLQNEEENIAEDVQALIKALLEANLLMEQNVVVNELNTHVQNLLAGFAGLKACQLRLAEQQAASDTANGKIAQEKEKYDDLGKQLQEAKDEADRFDQAIAETQAKIEQLRADKEEATKRANKLVVVQTTTASENMPLMVEAVTSISLVVKETKNEEALRKRVRKLKQRFESFKQTKNF